MAVMIYNKNNEIMVNDDLNDRELVKLETDSSGNIFMERSEYDKISSFVEDIKNGLKCISYGTFVDGEFVEDKNSVSRSPFYDKRGRRLAENMIIDPDTGNPTDIKEFEVPIQKAYEYYRHGKDDRNSFYSFNNNNELIYTPVVSINNTPVAPAPVQYNIIGKKFYPATEEIDENGNRIIKIQLFNAENN